MCIETNLTSLRKFIRVSGICERAELHPAEFASVDFGECAVGSICKHVFNVRNYGKFPCEFNIRYYVLTAPVFSYM
jgi:hypothetical protein